MMPPLSFPASRDGVQPVRGVICTSTSVPGPAHARSTTGDVEMVPAASSRAMADQSS
jgi:hypothetical protein